MSRTSHLLSQWARRSTDERLLNHLLPRVVRECAEYPDKWQKSPTSAVASSTMTALAKSDYQTLMVLLPRVSDPEVLHLFVRHHSKQVRAVLASNPHLTDADRAEVLRRARKENDRETVWALAMYASAETLDELRASGYDAFHIEWARAVARRDDAVEFVRAYVTSPSAERDRIEALARCVGDESLTGFSYEEFLSLFPENIHPAVARHLLSAVPVVTTEALALALRYFDEPGSAEFSFNRYVPFTDDALLLAATSARGALRPQLVHRVKKNADVCDQLLTTLEQARDVDKSLRNAVRGLINEGVTPANRVATLLLRVLEPLSNFDQIGTTYAESGYLEKHASVIDPPLLARLVPYENTGTLIEKWVVGKLGVTPPPIDVTRRALEQAALLRQSNQYQFLNWSAHWTDLAGDPPRLDLVLDLLGPQVFENGPDVGYQRIAQRFDEAAKDNVKVADLLLALCENWDGTLTQLIETAQALAAADDLDFTE